MDIFISTHTTQMLLNPPSSKSGLSLGKLGITINPQLNTRKMKAIIRNYWEHSAPPPYTHPKHD